MKFKLSYTVSTVYLQAATEQFGKLYKCYVINLYFPPHLLCEEIDFLSAGIATTQARMDSGGSMVGGCYRRFKSPLPSLIPFFPSFIYQ